MLDLRTDPVSSGFGTWDLWRQQAGLLWHAACDYPAPLGTPILAPERGEVVFTGSMGTNHSLGHFTVCDFGDRGILLAHQDRDYPELVGPVEEGDIIGFVGNTGFSTGPHTHVIMSNLRMSNGWFDFSRSGGGVIDARLYWDSNGYTQNPEVVLGEMFNRMPIQGIPVAVVTNRWTTKSELAMLKGAGLDTATIQQGGRFTTLNMDGPRWAAARFPDVIADNLVLTLKTE